MIPRISKLRKNDKDYKYGFRWSVKLNKYVLKTSTFQRACRIWKQEAKKWMDKKLHFKN